MLLEISTALDPSVTYNEACAFANQVMDRFRNPFLDHQWTSIAMNYTSKMKTRNLPLLLNHHKRVRKVGTNMALGFAGYLLFMKCKPEAGNKYYSRVNGSEFLVQDDMAPYFAEKDHGDINNFVDAILADTKLWGTDLLVLNGFEQEILENIRSFAEKGVLETIAAKELKNSVA
jgi:tagaturonate reductase